MNFENLLEKIYSKFIINGDFCIDVGAHSGRHTKPLAQLVGINGRVFAFEPNPTARLWLQDNLLEKINSSIVEVFPFALSNYQGKSNFKIAVDRPEESGLLTRVYNGPTDVLEIEVDLSTLDNIFLTKLKKLKFIKVDAEGAEYHIFLGAKRILLELKPILAFEFGTQSCSNYGIGPTDMFDYLHKLGYSIFSIYGDQLNRDQFVEAATLQKYWDYLACHPHHFDILNVSFDMKKLNHKTIITGITGQDGAYLAQLLLDKG